MPQAISTAFDPQFFQDFAKAQTLLDEYAKDVDSLSKKGITISLGGAPGDIANLVKSQQDLVKVTDELTLAVRAYKAIGDQKAQLDAKLAALGSDEAKALQASAVAVSEKTRALREAAQADNTEYQARIKRLQEERELDRLIAQEEKQHAKERTDAVRLATKEKADADREYTATWKRLLKERDDAEKKSAQEAAARAKQGQGSAVAAIDPTSLKYLSDRLNGLREGYSRLTQAERENAEIGGVVLNRIQELDAQLKATDASQGKFTRNVGNYASAYNGLGFALRNIAGELPNIGISFRTFAQSISNNIGPLTDAIKQAREQNKLLAAEGAPTVSIGKQIAGSIFSWQTAILALVAAFTAYAPKIAEFISGTKDATKEQEDLKKAVEETTSALETQIDKLNKNIQREGNRQNIGENEAKRRLELLKAQGASEKEILDAELAYSAARRKAIENEQSGYKNVRDEVNRAGQFFQQQDGANFRDTSTATGQNFSIAVQKTLREELRLTADEAKKQADIIVQAYGTSASPVIEIQRKIVDLGEDIKDVNNDAATTRAQFATNQREQAAKDAKEAAARRKKEKEERDKENEEETKRTLEETRGRFQKKAAQDRTDFENEKLSYNQRLSALDKYKFDELSIVKLSGAIQGKTIEEIQGAQAETVRKFAKIETDFIAEEAKKQQKIREGNIADAGAGTANNRTQSRPEFEQQQRKRLQDANDYASAAISTAQAIYNVEKALSDARIQNIEAEIAAIEKKRNADIDAVNDSALNEADKKEKIAAINARADAQALEREDKIRQEKRKSAEQEKALNIARIIIGTALAVVAQLQIGPAGIPAAVAAGALGAAELATAIATPIPSFAVGTEDAPEGVAQVHKGELYIPKDGSPPRYIDKDTLAYLNKGDIIKTAKETNELFQYFALGMPMLPHYREDKNAALLEELQESREVLKAIRDKRFPMQRSKPLWYEEYKARNNR